MINPEVYGAAALAKLFVRNGHALQTIEYVMAEWSESGETTDACNLASFESKRKTAQQVLAEMRKQTSSPE